MISDPEERKILREALIKIDYHLREIRKLKKQLLRDLKMPEAEEK